jgi:hypothetical protein
MNSTSDSRGSAGTGTSAGAIASGSTGVAAALLTLVTAACCVSPVVAPLIVGVLGASGAVWAAGLKPYGGWILGTSFLFLAYGFWSVYRPRAARSIADAPLPGRVLPRIAKGSLWVGAACWVAAVMLRLALP